MEGISLTTSTTAFLPSLSSRPSGGRRRPRTVVAGIKRSNSYGSGRQVDESMIVLRKRIHEMKVIERNYQPPSHWMDWEKQIYAVTYDNIICQALGGVQSRLMETRPSVAIAALALLGASVPTSFLLLTMQIASAIATVTAGN